MLESASSHEGVSGNGDISPRILNIVTRCRRVAYKFAVDIKPLNKGIYKHTTNPSLITYFLYVGYYLER